MAKGREKRKPDVRRRIIGYNYEKAIATCDDGVGTGKCPWGGARSSLSHTVTEIANFIIPSMTDGPRYRAININAIIVDTDLSRQCGNGVLHTDDDTIEALWMSYTIDGDDYVYCGASSPSSL